MQADKCTKSQETDSYVAVCMGARWFTYKHLCACTQRQLRQKHTLQVCITTQLLEQACACGPNSVCDSQINRQSHQMTVKSDRESHQMTPHSTSWCPSMSRQRTACTCQEDSHMRGLVRWYLVLDELSDCSLEATHMPGCMEA